MTRGSGANASYGASEVFGAPEPRTDRLRSAPAFRPLQRSAPAFRPLAPAFRPLVNKAKILRHFGTSGRYEKFCDEMIIEFQADKMIEKMEDEI